MFYYIFIIHPRAYLISTYWEPAMRQVRKSSRNIRAWGKLSPTNNVSCGELPLFPQSQHSDMFKIKSAWTWQTGKSTISLEQRFFGNDKVHAGSNGSPCIALQSPAINVACSSGGKAPSCPWKHQAPAVWRLSGRHNDRCLSSPGLGCVCSGPSLVLVLRGRSCRWRMLCCPGGEAVAAGLSWLFTRSFLQLAGQSAHCWG